MQRPHLYVCGKFPVDMQNAVCRGVTGQEEDAANDVLQLNGHELHRDYLGKTEGQAARILRRRGIFRALEHLVQRERRPGDDVRRDNGRGGEVRALGKVWKCGAAGTCLPGRGETVGTKRQHRIYINFTYIQQTPRESRSECKRWS